MRRLVTLTIAIVFLLGSQGPRGVLAAEEGQRKPFAVEYYYKIKWGHFDEFMELYKRNHYPILQKIQEQGEIVEMRAAYPRNHAGEESRWDFRYTIVWKDAETAHADADRTAILEQLYPDKEKFLKEEQRRFNLLIEHMDVPITEEDFAGW